MGFNYLSGKTWKDITRDERNFCYDLIYQLRINKTESIFISWLIEYCNLELTEKIDLKTYEISVEVNYYRDLIFHHELTNNMRFENKKSIKGLLKRAFDLCIFLPNDLIIIEAKAAQGMSTKQLKEFKKDYRAIRSCHEGLDVPIPKIHMVGLVSQEYLDKADFFKNENKKNKYFQKVISWQQIQDDCGCKYKMPDQLFTIYSNTQNVSKSAALKKPVVEMLSNLNNS